MRSPRIILTILTLLVGLCQTPRAWGQSAAELRRAFINIRSDKVEFNCAEATAWLLQRREKLKGEMLAELSRTDRQGRDALLYVLFNTQSFLPDQVFMRLTINRILEQDGFVKKREVGQDHSELPNRSLGAHWEAWRFVDSHFKEFEPLLTEQLKTTDNIFFIWGLASCYNHRKLLTARAPLFTNLVLGRAVTSLRDDKVMSNASQAARLFIMLGQRSLATLQAVARKSNDGQERDFAKALVDAITSGSPRAFRELCGQLCLERTIFEFGEGDLLGVPGWIQGGPSLL